MTARCTGCGSSLSDEATVCDQCGGAVTRSSPTQPVPPAGPATQLPPDGPAHASERPAASSVSTARPEPEQEDLQVGRAATFQLPDLRNRKLWLLVVAGVLVVVLIVAVGFWATREEEPPSAEETVQAFFDALRARNANKALAQIEEGGGPAGWSSPSEVLLSDQALNSKWYKPPRKVQVGTVTQTRDGDGVIVNVTYTVAGETVTKPLRLYLDEADEESGTAGRWYLSRWQEQGVTGTLYLTITAPEYEVNGVEFSTKETEQAVGMERFAVLGAFPGTYRVGLPDNPLIAGVPRRVGVVSNADSQRVTVSTKLKDSGVAEVGKQVNGFLDKCAAREVLDPEVDGHDCPFTSYGGIEGADEDQRLIQWTMKKYPKYDVELGEGESGGVYVSPGGGREDQGVVELTYTANDAFTREEVHPDQIQRFSIEGPVAVKRGKITWTPRT